MRARAAVSCVVLLLATSASGDGFVIDRAKLLPVSMKEVTLDPVVQVRLAGTATRATGRIHHDAAGQMRIEVQIGADGDTAGWRLRVLRPDGSAAPGLDLVASAEHLGERFWSAPLTAETVRVELTRADPGVASPTIRVSRYAHSQVAGTLQAVVGEDELEAIAGAPDTWKRRGRAVARLRVMADGIGEAHCTGFVVGSKLLMTNHHCVASDAEARSMIAEFGVDRDSASPKRVRVVGRRAFSESLDYAVLALDPQSNDIPDSLPLRAVRPLREAHALAIVQHPGGQAKHISLLDCVVSVPETKGTGPGKSDFGHACDTRGGSSGSPVMDAATGEVIGLHHLGFIPGSETTVNQAVYIEDVLIDLGERLLGVPASR